MRLERYNQLLIAVLGTGAGIGGVALAAGLALLALREARPARILVDQQAPDRPRQELVFCQPTIVPKSGLQLLPVAVRAIDESKDVRVTSPPGLASYSPSDQNCGLSRYGWAGQIFNVVVRTPGTDQQRLLLDRPSQIEALHMPHEDCARGEGPVPCGLLQWHIRDTDSNADGAISGEDALVAYHSSSVVDELRPVTPGEASLVTFLWDPKRNSILFQVRFDRSGDRRFDEDDPTEILELALESDGTAKQVVSPEIRHRLESQVR